MTDYILEFFTKGARKPYNTVLAALPNGFHPTYANTQECFGQMCTNNGDGTVKIRYKSNKGLAAITYFDRHNHKRLRWFR